jgi:hypothetical protein
MAQKFVVDTRINREGQEEYLSTRTYVGMAHIAGTGPSGSTCRECRFWMSRGMWRKKPGFGNVPEPQDAPCRKARSLMMRSNTPAFPHNAEACRFFDAALVAQPLKNPRAAWELEL